jgi:hypothetical protein
MLFPVFWKRFDVRTYVIFVIRQWRVVYFYCSKVGCIDARYLATYHASTVMFSSGNNKNGIGSKWVQWPLPHGRESDSLWTHSVGRTTVSKASMYPVTVKAWNGKGQVWYTRCNVDKFGLLLWSHMGSEALKWTAFLGNRGGGHKLAFPHFHRTQLIFTSLTDSKWFHCKSEWDIVANFRKKNL